MPEVQPISLVFANSADEDPTEKATRAAAFLKEMNALYDEGPHAVHGASIGDTKMGAGHHPGDKYDYGRP